MLHFLRLFFFTSSSASSPFRFRLLSFRWDGVASPTGGADEEEKELLLRCLDEDVWGLLGLPGSVGGRLNLLRGSWQRRLGRPLT